MATAPPLLIPSDSAKIITDLIFHPQNQKIPTLTVEEIEWNPCQEEVTWPRGILGNFSY